MKKWFNSLLLLLLFIFATPILAITFSASLDRYVIASGETVRLILTTDQQYVTTSPDLSALQKKFYILGTSKRTVLNIVNNNAAAETQWQITLKPRTGVIGKITIPPIYLGQQYSKQLTLVIKRASALSTTPHRKDLFLRASVSQYRPYVQQQVIYTLKLYTTTPIANGRINLPQPANAIVKQLGQDKTYETILNGETYQVLQRRYIIFPQKSGAIQIGPPVLNAYVATPRAPSGFSSDPFFSAYTFNAFFNSAGRPINVVGRAIKLSVQPKPTSFKNQWWLPANQLHLTQSWSPNPPQFRVGDAVTRTITLRAQGVATAQLPDVIQGQLSGVNVYPDKPVTENVGTTSGLVAIRQQKFALVPTRAGKITLPAIKIPWWNAKTGQRKVAVIPAQTINILPPVGKTVVIHNSPKRVIAKATHKKQITKVAKQLKPQQHLVSKTSVITTWWPWLIAGAMFFTWLITLLLWRRQKRLTKTTTASKKEFSGEKKVSTNAARHTLKTACDANDPQQAKQALLELAQSKWPNKKMRGLTDIANQMTATDLRAALRNLDRTLYASKKTMWNGKQFWQVFTKNFSESKPINKNKDDKLPPLYLQHPHDE